MQVTIKAANLKNLILHSYELNIIQRLLWLDTISARLWQGRLLPAAGGQNMQRRAHIQNAWRRVFHVQAVE